MRNRVNVCIVALAVLALGTPTLGASGSDQAGSAAPAVAAPSPVALFNEVWALVRDDFVDPSLGGLDWTAVGDRYRQRVMDAPAAWATTVNAMLDELETSHTRLYTNDEPAYFQLLGIFGDFVRAEHAEFYETRFGTGPVRYPGIGIFTAQQEGETVVTGVLESLPAQAAGLRVGDVVLTVDGQPFHPVASFRAAVEAERVVEMTLRRQAHGSPTTLRVMPRLLNAETMFVDAMRASARIEQHDDVAVAYVHAWSYSGRQYQNLLEELVRFGGPLASADALVLDLRGGWGGASTEYLRLFLRDVPVLSMRPRDGEWTTFDPQWRKPVVALIDGTTRSGKETLAWGVRHLGIGVLVGETTAGAVVGGRPHVLADGSVLYLAVAEVRINGERLEGRGVSPDVVVPFTPHHAAGVDPQRVRAIAVAAERARAANKAGPNLK